MTKLEIWLMVVGITCACVWFIISNIFCFLNDYKYIKRNNKRYDWSDAIRKNDYFKGKYLTLNIFLKESYLNSIFNLIVYYGSLGIFIVPLYILMYLPYWVSRIILFVSGILILKPRYWFHNILTRNQKKYKLAEEIYDYIESKTDVVFKVSLVSVDYSRKDLIEYIKIEPLEFASIIYNNNGRVMVESIDCDFTEDNKKYTFDSNRLNYIIEQMNKNISDE